MLTQIAAEDRNTDFICIGPINKLYHLVWHHARPGGPEFKRHLERLPEYLWQAEDGTKVQGYHSSQLWDTAFATRAMLATGEVERCRSSLQRAHDFIDQNQVRADLPEREQFFRDAVMTSWALLGLLAGGRAGSSSVQEGARFLSARQREDGSYRPSTSPAYSRKPARSKPSCRASVPSSG